MENNIDRSHTLKKTLLLCTCVCVRGRLSASILFPEFWEKNAGRQPCSTSVFNRKATSPAQTPYYLYDCLSSVLEGTGIGAPPTAHRVLRVRSPSLARQFTRPAGGSDWAREAETRPRSSG